MFDLYVNYLGDIVLDTWSKETPSMKVKAKDGRELSVDALDIVATKWSDRPGLAIAAVNKEPEESLTLFLNFHSAKGNVKLFTISGNSTESYNDMGHEEVRIEESEAGAFRMGMEIALKAHSVNVIWIEE